MNLPQVASPQEITSSMANAWEKMSALFNGFVKATHQSNTAAMQGLDALTRDMSGIVQKNYAQAVDARINMMSAKTAQELTETHTNFLKTCVDNLVSDSKKISEMSLQVGKTTIEPLAQHTSETMNALIKKNPSA